jgi:uncharacterized protein (TIGR00730 family)
MARRFPRVQSVQSGSIPRRPVAKDQSTGRPGPSATRPHREQVAGRSSGTPSPYAAPPCDPGSPMSPRSRHRTGDAGLDRRIDDLLDAAGATANRDVLSDIFVSAVGLAGDGTDRLDLKIASAALREMRSAYRAFAPYRMEKKVTIFGSARTEPTDPLYVQARELAAALAARGWMVVTGAGPGIMAAGLEGAGRDRSFGVRIRLPFEQDSGPLLVGDDRLVSMKYFFTRKLMLMKESHGFVSLPGGVGTLDEVFELLTLQQTGKALPTPLVLLDVPGGTYWDEWAAFLGDDVASRGYIDAEDLDLFTITDDVGTAVDRLIGFYRNYHSLRWVGDRLVIRLHAEPTDDEMAGLADRFSALAVDGVLERTGPLPPEQSDGDHVDLPRLVLRFDIFRMGGLHRLIDAVNALRSAPTGEEPEPPVPAAEPLLEGEPVDG